MRPVFHALARTTNATAHLRFGEVDCVKYRGVCSMLEVDSQPRIRLYKAAGGAEAAKARLAEKGKTGRVQTRWLTLTLTLTLTQGPLPCATR